MNIRFWITETVGTIFEFQRRLPAGEARRKHTLKRELRTSELTIDALVYRLYELTDEEIAIVKGKKK